MLYAGIGNTFKRNKNNNNKNQDLLIKLKGNKNKIIQIK